MDLNNIGEAEDRISDLPDSILHHILSFLDIKPVARTCVLSRRWNRIWTSIPTLDFQFWDDHSKPYLSSHMEISKFSDFVDRTLHLHDARIRKFSLDTNKHMKPSQVHSWISSLTRRNVEELDLHLDLETPFSIPLSLFTCQSLIKLELSVDDTTQLPRSYCFPKLRSLKLNGIRFTDDCTWDEQHFSNCPVLEDLYLGECTWHGVRNFCISTPTLKVLKIIQFAQNGLQNCALKIHAPNLLSLDYWGCVAKEFVLSSFQELEFATVDLCEYGAPTQQRMGYSAAVSKFFRALSHVPGLALYPSTLETLSTLDDFARILPTFHELNELILKEGIEETTDKSLFPLFKAVPNLRWLVIEEGCLDDNKEEEHSWATCMLTAGCMFQHLRSVTFKRPSGNARQMRWVKLILKNAIALEVVILYVSDDDNINREVFMSELRNLPRASDGCEFELN